MTGPLLCNASVRPCARAWCARRQHHSSLSALPEPSRPARLLVLGDGRCAKATLFTTVSRRIRRQQRQLIAVRLPGRLLTTLAVAAGLRGCALTAQPLNLLVESLDVLKVAIHRGKADVSHLIE